MVLQAHIAQVSVFGIKPRPCNNIVYTHTHTYIYIYIYTYIYIKQLIHFPNITATNSCLQLKTVSDLS